ncbi:hypothetical protein [Aliamphritea spongicola]|uniref:hypothetical protein n=1 Tax=Aliamphritea spongicola TaxID=707589 RepID=UPI00196B37A0|nr:hypothetical protein [Aliamphritea spongicola]MBN3563593.1 hypothetical protein [Aliamphritea spongicola]
MSPVRLFIAFIISLLLISCAVDYQQEPAPERQTQQQQGKPAASSIEQESREAVQDAAEPALKRAPADDDDDMLRLD